MFDRTLTQSELLSIWERGEGQRTSRRTLALLEGAAPDSDAAELAALPIGRRDAALLDLREQLFGSAFAGVTSCPACGEEIELSFEAREVRRDPVPSSSIRIDDELEMRLPNTEDLAAIEDLDDLAAAREQLIARCVIRGHPDARVLSDLDPQADVQLDVDCPACGHAWREPFDIVTFLWAEVSVFARRLLGEVHELASAYGWSEEQILALSPARRNAYLEMLR